MIAKHEEFLERWKKLSSKEEERPSEVAIKKPPRMMPRLPERRDDRISEISVSQDIENLREKLKEKFDEKSKIPKRPPGRPKESPRGRPMGRPVERPTGMPKDRIHIRQPRGLERRGPPLKKTDGLVEPEPGR